MEWRRLPDNWDPLETAESRVLKAGYNARRWMDELDVFGWPIPVL